MSTNKHLTIKGKKAHIRGAGTQKHNGSGAPGRRGAGELIERKPNVNYIGSVREKEILDIAISTAGVEGAP